jgi:hypothetical protein
MAETKEPIMQPEASQISEEHNASSWSEFSPERLPDFQLAAFLLAVFQQQVDTPKLVEPIISKIELPNFHELQLSPQQLTREIHDAVQRAIHSGLLGQKKPETDPAHATNNNNYEGPETESIIRRAIDVIGEREQALRWMGTPVQALGYATPISLLNDAAGAQQVMDVLAALEQGVW